jgi:cytochrome c
VRALWFIVALLALPSAAGAEGNADRGAQYFRACAACHSLEPGRNMTGPSLADIFERKAGALSSFHRYSPALKSAGVIWNADTLDPWLTNPAHFVPGNWMTFPGIENAQARADLIAFLKIGFTFRKAQQDASGNPKDGGMGMAGGQEKDLKTGALAEQVRAISNCEDTYRIITGDGRSRDWWEHNLRFKTDSSDRGPEKGKPVILPAGMMGDRSTVIFAEPGEISGFVRARCDKDGN